MWSQGLHFQIRKAETMAKLMSTGIGAFYPQVLVMLEKIF
jgi:hypothetical protein